MVEMKGLANSGGIGSAPILATYVCYASWGGGGKPNLPLQDRAVRLFFKVVGGL